MTTLQDNIFEEITSLYRRYLNEGESSATIIEALTVSTGIIWAIHPEINEDYLANLKMQACVQRGYQIGKQAS